MTHGRIIPLSHSGWRVGGDGAHRCCLLAIVMVVVMRSPLLRGDRVLKFASTWQLPLCVRLLTAAASLHGLPHVPSHDDTQLPLHRCHPVTHSRGSDGFSHRLFVQSSFDLIFHRPKQEIVIAAVRVGGRVQETSSFPMTADDGCGGRASTWCCKID